MSSSGCAYTGSPSGACTESPCPIMLASGQSASGVIAIDGESVYWTSLRDGTVMRTPIAGGAPVVLASGQMDPRNLTKDLANVFWTAAMPYGNSLWRTPLGGGTAYQVPDDQLFQPGGLAVDATNVYWGNDNGSVEQMPVGGGEVLTLNPDTFDGQVADLVIDATNIYWADSTLHTVMKVPIGGGIPVTLAAGQNGLARIAVDSTNIYWTASNDGTVMMAPLYGGPAVTLAVLQSRPTGIAVDGASVYWTNNAGAGSCALGSVMKLPLGGGTPTTIASNQLYPDGIAVDGTSVYWTAGVSNDLSVYNGAVMKLTPK
jgi:hypothetical protein